jgi:hypothetical protein
MFQQELAIIQMDADAEVARSRLGAINCQVHDSPHYTTKYFFQRFPIHPPPLSPPQRTFRGHVARIFVRALRLQNAEAIKRAFAERMT